MIKMLHEYSLLCLIRLRLVKSHELVRSLGVMGAGCLILILLLARLAKGDVLQSCVQMDLEHRAVIWIRVHFVYLK